MCCILCSLHKCNYIILYLWHVFSLMIGTPDLFKSLFDLAKLFIKADIEQVIWIVALYKYSYYYYQ